MSDPIGTSPKVLHELAARAENATAGIWRAVGRTVVSGEYKIVDAVLPPRGSPDQARLNATYIASASPSTVHGIVNELLRLRREVLDARRAVEEMSTEVSAMRAEVARARAVAAAVTLPTTAKAAETAGRVARRLKELAPDASGLIDQLAAIARARAEVEEGDP